MEIAQGAPTPPIGAGTPLVDEAVSTALDDAEIDLAPATVEEGSSSTDAFGSELTAAIRSSVIPRLYAAHDEQQPQTDSQTLGSCARSFAENRLLALVLASDTAGQDLLLNNLLADGCGLEDLLLAVVAPTIHAIGRMWEDDRMTFADVTMKSAHLQRIVQSLPVRVAQICKGAGRAWRVLLSPAPGDQHTLGVTTLASLLSEKGLIVDRLAEGNLDTLTERMASGQYDCIGLSVGSERLLSELPATLARLREADQNPPTPLMIGGWAFQQHVKSIDDYDADLVVTDGHAAASQVCRLLDSRSPMSKSIS